MSLYREPITPNSLVSIDRTTIETQTRTVQELADLTGESVADVIASIEDGSLGEWLDAYGDSELTESGTVSGEVWSGRVL
jgi:hypothetical protein